MLAPRAPAFPLAIKMMWNISVRAWPSISKVILFQNPLLVGVGGNLTTLFPKK